MPFPIEIPTHSLLGHILRKPQIEQERLRQEHEKQKQERIRNVEHLTSIAGQYGYGADSVELRSLLDDHLLGAELLIASAFRKEAKWHEAFDPTSSTHVEYRNGTLVVLKYPHMISRPARNYGAARADIVRARLATGWEELCDRIVVDSHETTFFEGDAPVVIFYGSGRSGGRVDNAIDALSTHAGIEIDSKTMYTESRTSPLVIQKVNGEWTWPPVR